MKMNTKKTIRILAALMFAVCIIFALSSCGGGGNTGCAHTMTKTAAKAATCDQDGNIEYYTCSTCNKVFADAAGTTETTLAKTVVAKTGHKAGAEATCTTAQICTVCNAELAAAKGHTVGEFIAEVPATCTEDGTLGHYTCSVCQKNLDADKKVLESLVIPAGHSLEDVAEKLANGCEDGYTAHKKCSACDYKEGYEVLPAPHDLMVIPEQAATTCVDGYTAGKMCANCDYKEGMEVIPAEHAYGDVISGVPATCLIAGYADYQICSECRKIKGAENLDPLGHDLQPVDAKAATCYTDGYNAHQKCSRCYYTKDKIVYPAGHTGEWVSVDDNYEYIICTVESCGRKAVREKNAVINFEGGSILANDKLAITDVAAGATEGGNARDKFTLVDDASNKVLQVINSKENAGAATAGKITLNHTDPLNKNNADADGGKYLITEFDAKFDFESGTNSSKVIFQFKVFDSGSNFLCAINFYSYNQKLKINTTEIDYVADGTTWLTFRAVTTLTTTGSSEKSTTNIYYKHRDSDGPMTLAVSVPRDTYGIVTRPGAHTVKFEIGPNDFDYTYYLDNMSFIRTNDANYTYSACAHEIEETVATVDCTQDKVVTRKCTKDGCGYVVTETLPGTASGHELSAWADIEGGKQERACANCDYAVTRDALPAGSVQFDDGTITSGGKLNYSTNVTIADDGKTATSTGDYATISAVDAPGRDGEIALNIKTVLANIGASNVNAPRITVPVVGNAGTNYTVDFDLYNVATYNGARVVMQLGFGNAGISIYSYRDSVQLNTPYGEAQLGKCETWISVRFVFVVTAGGSADYEAFVKNAEGEYVSVKTGTATGSGIYLDRACSFEFFTYCTQVDRDYYIDNISYTRSTCAHNFSEWTVTPATCLIDGSKTRTCSKCDEVETEVISATGHTGEWVAATDANYEELVCSACDRIITREKNTPVDFNGEQIDLTDALHGKADGKYLVLDFDMKFDAFTGTNTGVVIFNLRLFEGLGNNSIADFIFYNYMGKLRVGPTNYVVDANDKSGDVWFTFRVVTELADDANGTCVTKLYYKVKGTDGPMTLLMSANAGNVSYGTVDRAASHYYKLVLSANAADYNYELKNISFIRTADANYTLCECDHAFKETVTTPAGCDTNGILTITCTNENCGYTATEAIPAAGHTLGNWTDAADGIHEELKCANCTYTITRVKGTVTFDDGTITDGGNVTFVTNNVTMADDQKSAVDDWGYAKWSITNEAPEKAGNNVLCLETDSSKWASGQGRAFSIAATGTEGTVYTLDFDIYILPGANATSSGTSRVVTEISFGGKTYNIGTYGSRVTRYAQSFSFGTTKTWISLRLQYTITEEGKATIVASYKNAEGNYTVADTLAVEGTGFKLDGVSTISFTSYRSGGSFTCYYDNISFTRTAAAAE